MQNKEFLIEQAKMLSLIERHEKNMTWLDAERNKGKWLNRARNIWCTNEEFKRYRALDEDNSELMAYKLCDKRLTGLAVNLWLPQLHEDIELKHPLWMYVENSLKPTLDVIPLTISSEPIMMVEGKSIDIPRDKYNEALEFITINHKAILDFANNKIDSINEHLIRLDGKTLNEYLYGGDNKLVLEYYKVVNCEDTGLPIPIWVDEGGTYQLSGHAPRIKFPGSKETSKATTSWSSVLIDEKPMVFNLPKDKPYPSKVINKVIEFVAANHELLLDITSKKVALDDVKDQFIKV